MSTDRGLRGAPDRALGIRIAAPLALLLALLTPALLAPVANADTIAAKRQEANRVYQQIVQSQQQLESVVQQYDQATEQLHTTQAAIRFNKSRLHAAKRNLRNAQKDLEGALVAAYKQGQPDALQAVLASKSLSQMMDEIDLMKRATHFNASTVARVNHYKSEVIKRQNALAHERTRRTRVVKVQRARKLADHVRDPPAGEHARERQGRHPPADHPASAGRAGRCPGSCARRVAHARIGAGREPAVADKWADDGPRRSGRCPGGSRRGRSRGLLERCHAGGAARVVGRRPGGPDRARRAGRPVRLRRLVSGRASTAPVS